jgi:uncharacterized protein YwgA
MTEIQCLNSPSKLELTKNTIIKMCMEQDGSIKEITLGDILDFIKKELKEKKDLFAILNSTTHVLEIAAEKIAELQQKNKLLDDNLMLLRSRVSDLESKKEAKKGGGE